MSAISISLLFCFIFFPDFSLSDCITSSKCPPGQVCSQSVFDFSTICRSQSIVSNTLSLSPAPLPPRLPSSGRFLDYCNTFPVGKCQPGFRCASLTPSFPVCTEQSQRCVCVNDSPIRCLKDSDCVRGDVCAEVNQFEMTLCVPRIVEQRWLKVKKLPSKKSLGLNLDPCSLDSECKGNRLCFWMGGRSLVRCNNRKFCACFETVPPVCDITRNCKEPQEVCAFNELLDEPDSFCTSIRARNVYTWVFQAEELSKPICPVLIGIDRPRSPIKVTPPGRRRIGAGLVRQMMRSSKVLALGEPVVASPAIAGGLRASDNLRRYMVVTRGLFFCSGILISKRWMISAAHCELRKGDRVLFGVNSVDGPERERDVGILMRVFKHPLHNRERGFAKYDITVAEFERPAPDWTRAMTLNGNKSIPVVGQPVRAAGYGAEDKNFLPDEEKVLRQVDMRVQRIDQCEEKWKRIKQGIDLQEGINICSGVQREGCSIW